MEKIKNICKRVLKAYCKGAAMMYPTGTIPVRIDL